MAKTDKVPLERHVTAQCTRFLESLKRGGREIWWVKLHGGSMQRAGLPDLLVLLDGKLFAIELKRPGGAPTRLQIATLTAMARAGATAAVVDNVETFKALLVPSEESVTWCATH
ncbi:MAG: hypothetical protein ACOY3P_14340 [Planctomycetota bacterium]